MSDNPKPTKGELILSQNAGLAIKKLNLVKRGLELVPDLKKKDLKILIGDSADCSVETIIGWMNGLMSDEFNITYVATRYADEILEHAKNSEFDIFILFTNNVIFPSDNRPWQKRIIQVTQLATYLRMTYKKPLVAMTTTIDFYLAASQAGADLNFRAPLKKQDWKDIMHILAPTPKS